MNTTTPNEKTPSGEIQPTARAILGGILHHRLTGPLADLTAADFRLAGLEIVATPIFDAIAGGAADWSEILMAAIAGRSQRDADFLRQEIIDCWGVLPPGYDGRPECFAAHIKTLRDFNANPGTRGDGPRGLDRFRVDHEATLGLSWREIDELRPPFVIDGFVRQGELLLLGAESKSRKSWLAQDAGLCVATGSPWLADETGRDGFEVNAGKVWVMDLELADTEAAYRFAKARGNRWPDDITTQRRATANFATYSLDGMGTIDIMAMIDELQPRLMAGDLVVVDCFYRLQPDGNEASEVALAMERLKRLAGETGAAVIVVDHFRKAGDDKARNRFAGSFIKQASAATLVAVEIRGEVMELNIDARTFHGCPKVAARFDLESYRFVRVPEVELAAAKVAKDTAEGEAWIVAGWHGRHPDAPITAADAGEAWRVSRQAATSRLDRLVERGFLAAHDRLPGASRQWSLNAKGLATLAAVAP